MDACEGQRAWSGKAVIGFVAGQHTTMPKKDKAREDRIIMEIVVDAYDENERALGWYYYLEDKLAFPFRAKCVARRGISPLKRGEEVAVVGMPLEDECEREMFVTVEWKKRSVAVPLSQLRGVDVGEETQKAIEDWRYWVRQGYEF